MDATYRSLLRNREFNALLGSQLATVVSLSVSGLVIGIIVNDKTGSPLLTALSMFTPALANIIGGATLMSLADTASPRPAMTVLQIVSAALVGFQAFPLPIAGRFALLIAGGAVSAVAGGIRFGILSELVPNDAYAPARSLLNIVNSAMQIVGFAFGATLVAYVDNRVTFIGGSVVMLLGAAAIRFRVRDHSVRMPSPPSIKQTWAVNRWLVQQPNARVVICLLWVPNGLIVGCESLFIPYAGSGGGYLLTAGAIGMLISDLFVARALSSVGRRRINLFQRFLLAAPYLGFLFVPNVVAAAFLVFVSSIGFSASLGLQETLVRLTPSANLGQVQGVESSGRIACQGLGAFVSGSLAEAISVPLVMAIMACVSIVVTLAAWLPMRRVESEVPLVCRA